MKARLEALGCPEEKIQIVHLGVDLDRIGFRERRAPSGRRVRVLYAGRLVEKKQVLDALEAFKKVADLRQDIEFCIVGDGDLRPSVEVRIRQLNLEDRVVLRGAVSHAETLREMDEADLFILPSATAPNGDMEGTPTVLMEAQASGLPVVSTFHADIPEVVVDGESGLLAPERDIGVLAKHLKHLLDDPGCWAEMGAAGRRHVEENYDIRREVGKLEGVYKRLLTRG